MARIDDYAPDLWQVAPEGTTEKAETGDTKDEDETTESAPLAYPTRFLAPGGSLSLFSGKFQDPETIELHEDLAAWEAENPYDASKQLELGYHYLYVMQDYPKAVLAYHSALKVFDSDPEMHVDLGKAYYGMGEFKKAWDVYGAALKLDSRNPDVRRLRLEAGEKYLQTLEEAQDAKEIARVRNAVVIDKAMGLALSADRELASLPKIRKQLDLAQSPEDARAMLDRVFLLAQSYGALGGVPFDDPADAEFVRGELSVLAGETFGMMAAAAQESPYAEVNRLLPFYHGLSDLARGDIENAREQLAKVRSELPEADAILQTMERDDLRAVNLSALDVWESTVEGHDEYADQKPLIDRLRSSLRAGEHATIKETLAGIAASEEEDDALRVFAQDLLDRTSSADTGGSEILPHLIEYASTGDPSEDMVETLFEDARRTEAAAPQGSYGVYCLLEATSPVEKFREWAKAGVEELTRDKSFLESFGRAVLAILPTSTDELVLTVASMGIAQSAGALAKLAALNRLAKAGIVGKNALRIALAAEFLVEGHALYALNTAQDAVYHGVEGLTPERLAMNYGATLLTLGGLKSSLNFGKKLGPRFARALGMVETGGYGLSKAGTLLAWATVQTFGFAGMAAGTQANQLLSFADVPRGGFGESLAHDLVSFVKYGVAGKMLNHALGPKFAFRSAVIEQRTALREAQLMAEAHVKTLGYTPTGRTADGFPVFESDAGRLLYCQMLYLSASDPGFDGAKIGDADYLKSFGLKAKYEGGRMTGLEPISLHEELGVADTVPLPLLDPDDTHRLYDKTVNPGGLAGPEIPAEIRRVLPLAGNNDKTLPSPQPRDAESGNTLPLSAGTDSRTIGLDAWRQLEAKPASKPEDAMTQEKFHNEVVDSWAQRDARKSSARNARRSSGDTGVTRLEARKSSEAASEPGAAVLSPADAVAFGYVQAWEGADYWSGIRGNFPILLRATGKILKMTMHGNLPPATGAFAELARTAGAKTENPEIQKRAGLMARALERVYDYYPEGDPQKAFIEGEVAALTSEMAANSSEAALPVYWSRLSDVFAHLLIEHAGRADGAPRNPVLDFQLEVASEYAIVPGAEAARRSYRTQRF